MVVKIYECDVYLLATLHQLLFWWTHVTRRCIRTSLLLSPEYKQVADKGTWTTLLWVVAVTLFNVTVFVSTGLSGTHYTPVSGWTARGLWRKRSRRETCETFDTLTLMVRMKLHLFYLFLDAGGLVCHFLMFSQEFLVSFMSDMRSGHCWCSFRWFSPPCQLFTQIKRR